MTSNDRSGEAVETPGEGSSSEAPVRPAPEQPAAHDHVEPSESAAPPASDPDVATDVEPMGVIDTRDVEPRYEPVADAAPPAEPDPEPAPETSPEPELSLRPQPSVEAAAAEPEPAPAEPSAFASADPGPASDEPEEAAAMPADVEPKTPKDEFVEIAKTIFYALLIALVLRILFFQPFTIPSASMEPNLYEGDYIIVSKWSYGYSRHSVPFSPPLFDGRVMSNNRPQRGDVVVFKLPRDNRTDYIKRVVGLPGDRIQMRDNQLYINGRPVPVTPVGPIEVATPFGYSQEAMQLRENLPAGPSHLIQDFSANADLDNTPEFTVPAGHYFMMGDNRDNSVDSRVSPEFGVGFVPEENIVGKAQMILFSWSPGASLFKPWTWFTKIRPSRFFTSLQ